MEEMSWLKKEISRKGIILIDFKREIGKIEKLPFLYRNKM
jgi:hypothetical protein